MLRFLTFVMITALLSIHSHSSDAQTISSSDPSHKYQAAQTCWGSSQVEVCQRALVGIQMLTKNDGWIVGAQGTILHWDGQMWSLIDSPTTINLLSVDAIDSTDAWAVGANGTILHWQSGSWTQLSSPVTDTLNSVDMLSADNGWIVGYDGRILHWDGTTWKQFSSPTSEGLYQVKMVTSTDGWIVGSNGSLLRWNGFLWSLVTVPTNYSLASIDMVSPSIGFIVTPRASAYEGIALHLSGTTWQKVTLNSFRGMGSVSAVSASAAWAVSGWNEIAHWDGSSWTITNGPQGSIPESVDMVTDVDGWIVGWYGMILHWDGASWSVYDKSTIKTFSISGTVVDTNGQPLNDVQVLIEGSGGNSVSTDSNGNYTFATLPAGTYTLTTNKSGYVFSPSNRQVILPPNATQSDFIGSLENTLTKVPIIFLPGTGASTNLNCFYYGMDCDDQGSWVWTKPRNGIPHDAERDYQFLIETLKNAGYDSTNRFFTVFHYDWRRPIAENVDKLRNWINQVKFDTKSTRVDLVGHSQGGLIARAYAQDALYQSDVRNLITLGAPHYGIPRAYPFWEGGVYYRTGKERYGMDLICKWNLRTTCAGNATLLQQEYPIFRDLLPIYDYVVSANLGFKTVPESSLTPMNRNVAVRLLDSTLHVLYQRGINITTIASYGIQTPITMTVRDRLQEEINSNPQNWLDGVPLFFDEPKYLLGDEGDYTIPYRSAILPPPATVISVQGVKHDNMGTSPIVVYAVLGVLNIAVPVRQDNRIHVEADAAVPTAIMVRGAENVTITNSTGQVTSLFTSTIPDAVVIADSSKHKTLIVLPESKGMNIAIETVYGASVAIAGYLGASPTDIVTNSSYLWDDVNLNLATPGQITFSLALSITDSTVLQPLVPIIIAPVSLSGPIYGRAAPNSRVVIVDADTGSIVGSSISSPSGTFSVIPARVLSLKQRIRAVLGDVEGPIILIAQSNISLPILIR